MPVYEYICTNPDCREGSKAKPPVIQELIVPASAYEKDQPCRSCGKPAKWRMYHGKNHVRFHFNYME